MRSLCFIAAHRKCQDLSVDLQAEAPGGDAETEAGAAGTSEHFQGRPAGHRPHQEGAGKGQVRSASLTNLSVKSQCLTVYHHRPSVVKPQRTDTREDPLSMTFTPSALPGWPLAKAQTQSHPPSLL